MPLRAMQMSSDGASRLIALIAGLSPRRLAADAGVLGISRALIVAARAISKVMSLSRLSRVIRCISAMMTLRFSPKVFWPGAGAHGWFGAGCGLAPAPVGVGEGG